MSDDVTKTPETKEAEAAAPVEKSGTVALVDAVMAVAKADSAANAEKASGEVKEAEAAPEEESDEASESEAEEESDAEAAPALDDESSVPAQLRGYALVLGFTDDEIGSIGAERLKPIVEKALRATKAGGKPADKEAETAETTAEDDEDADLKELEDEADERLVRVLKKTRSELKTLRETAAKREAEEAERTKRSEAGRKAQETQVFDKALNDMADDGWKEVFGKGTYKTLGEDSPAFQNRKRLAIRLKTLATEEAETGSKRMPADRLDDALNGLFPKHVRKLHERKLADKLDEAEEDVSEPPTHRRSERGGDKSALKKAEEFYAGHR